MNVNVEKTRAYHQPITTDMLCECKYCRSYYAKAREAFPVFAQWLDGYGCDISKPLEVSYISPKDDDIMQYLVIEYIFFGSCSTDFSCDVGEIEVYYSSFHPSTDIEEEHFVLAASPKKPFFLS